MARAAKTAGPVEIAGIANVIVDHEILGRPVYGPTNAEYERQESARQEPHGPRPKRAVFAPANPSAASA